VIGELDDNQAYGALASRNFDIVCQFLAYDEKTVERDISLFSGRCGQYIFISTASVYRKPNPLPLIREDMPLGNLFWGYSRSKEACENRLLLAHRANNFPVTIVRPSHTYRERLPSVVVTGDHLAWRLLRRKPVIVPGDGESVWTLTHANDFARAFVQMCANEEALGECVHITDKVGYTWNIIIKTIADEIGVSAKVCGVLSQSLVGYEQAWAGPLLGDKSNTMIFDTRKIARLTGGWRCEVSLAQGIKRTWPHVSERLKRGYQPDEELDDLVDQIIDDHSVSPH
jgi:nucleoside-diphosphate-sugar epimerase